MTEKYPFQFNIKVGDHLLNINGETIEEAVVNLETVAGYKDRIHSAIEKLDGRPATEVVQKEKQWGGRSQYGRTYPKPSQHGQASTTSPAPATPATSAAPSPEQLLKDQLGATVVETIPNTTETPSTGGSTTPPNDGKVHNGQCVHGSATQRSGSKNGKDWKANFCSAKSCEPEWL